jgi:hypothetical protein
MSLNMIDKIIKYGRLPLLKKIHNNKFKLNKQLCRDIHKYNKQIYTAATKYGQLDILKYMFKIMRGANVYVCHVAAEYGHLECLKYLVENNVLWDKFECSRIAIKYGHLDCVKYIVECIMKEYGTFECGEVYAFESAVCGNLNCLKYIVENGFDWNSDKCMLETIREDKFECFKYILGCKSNVVDNVCLSEIIKCGHLHYIQYIIENGVVN